MSVVVCVLNGPETGRMIPLRLGQVARFGRTAWADFCVSNDSRLGDIHFEIRCEPSGRIVLKNLDNTGTFLDGTSVTEAALRPGQKIVAGQTVFSVLLNETSWPGLRGGGDEKRSFGAEDPRQSEGVEGHLELITAESICQYFELEETSPRPLDEKMSPGEFVALLVAGGHLRDALRFQAFHLPKPHAVWWAWRCLADTPALIQGDDVQRALDAAHDWLLEPSDENARTAGAVADALGYGPAESWVAMAAFWSGENIAPPATEAIAPPNHLTGVAVSSAVLLGSTDANPQHTIELQQNYLVLADLILRGDDNPPP